MRRERRVSTSVELDSPSPELENNPGFLNTAPALLGEKAPQKLQLTGCLSVWGATPQNARTKTKHFRVLPRDAPFQLFICLGCPLAQPQGPPGPAGAVLYSAQAQGNKASPNLEPADGSRGPSGPLLCRTLILSRLQALPRSHLDPVTMSGPCPSGSRKRSPPTWGPAPPLPAVEGTQSQLGTQLSPPLVTVHAWGK